MNTHSKIVLNVIFVAAAKGATIQQAAKELKTAPHPNTVSYHTDKFEIDTLETGLNSGDLTLEKQSGCAAVEISFHQKASGKNRLRADQWKVV